MREKIIEHISDIIDPVSGKTITEAKLISSVQEDGNGGVIVVMEVDPAQGAALEGLRQEVEQKITALPEVQKATVILTAEASQEKPPPPKATAPPKGTSPDPHGMAKNPPIDVPARNIIVVASGKGGVGKSTVSSNTAVSLANKVQKKEGGVFGRKRKNRVGLLDADIYGPSQPIMMGDEDYKPELNKKKQITPMLAHGVKVMSIGFMVDKTKALIWRGPMAQNAFYQMLRDVDWGSKKQPLDYLIIDMPPGTGDVQLTLAQKVKVSGAVIVSTPQDIALIDARRAVEMFKKTDIPVLGIVENMSTHICSNCGHEEHIFGHGGAEEEAKSLGVPFLGCVSLSKNIRLNADKGTPIAQSDPDSAQANAFAGIAEKLIAVLK